MKSSTPNIGKTAITQRTEENPGTAKEEQTGLHSDCTRLRRNSCRKQFSLWKLTAVSLLTYSLSVSAAFWMGRASTGSHAAGVPVSHSTIAALHNSQIGISQMGKVSDAKAASPNGAGKRLPPKNIVGLLPKSGSEMHTDALFKMIAWMADASETELAEVVAASKTANAGDGSNALLQIAFARWCQIDGLSAFEAFLTLDGEQRTSEVANSLFSTWMTNGSPEEALECAVKYQKFNPNGTRRLVDNVLRTLYEKDQGKTEQLAMGLCATNDAAEEGSSLLGTLRFMVNTRCDDSGLPAALALIDQCPQKDWQESMRSELAIRLLRSDAPDKQRQGYNVLAMLPNQYASIPLIEAVADRKLTDDAFAAKAWALSLPIGGTRQAAVTEIVQSLTNSDKIQEAVDWLGAQGSHSDYDGAYEMLATAALEKSNDGVAASSLSALITDETRRYKLNRTLAILWFQADFNAAARALLPSLTELVTQLDAPVK